MAGAGSLRGRRTLGLASSGYDCAGHMPLGAIGQALASLTSLHPAGAQPADILGGATGVGGGPGKRVLVVDAADRLSPTSLANLVDKARSTRTKLVLIPGGTAPGQGASIARSLDDLIESHAVSGLAQFTPTLLVGPELAGPEWRSVGILARGALSGTGAMAHLVANWSDGLRSGPPALMVAFGPAEVEALANAARGLLGLGSSAAAAEIKLGRNSYALGDQVLALRRIGPTRSAAHGTVVALGTCGLTVEWRDALRQCRSEVGPEHAGSLGYGYATTMPYLRSYDPELQGLFVLGDPTELARRSAQVKGAWVTLAGPGMPAVGPGGAAARRRAGLVDSPRAGPTRRCWSGRSAPPSPCQAATMGRGHRRLRSGARPRLPAHPSASPRRALVDHGAVTEVVAGRCQDVPDMRWPSKRQLRRFWRPFRIVAGFVLLGVAVWVVSGKSSQLSGASAYLTQLRWEWLGLAAAAELGCYTALAGVERVLIRAGHVPARLGRLTAITFAGARTNRRCRLGPPSPGCTTFASTALWEPTRCFRDGWYRVGRCVLCHHCSARRHRSLDGCLVGHHARPGRSHSRGARGRRAGRHRVERASTAVPVGRQVDSAY